MFELIEMLATKLPTENLVEKVEDAIKKYKSNPNIKRVEKELLIMSMILVINLNFKDDDSENIGSLIECQKDSVNPKNQD